MLAYGEEPWLVDAVRAVLDSRGVDVELIVVDNGCTSDAVTKVADLSGVRVLTPSENTGYAGGCNVGAAAATGEYLAFVNSDAIVAPDALAALVEVVREPTVGIAMASIRLGESPDLINTAGNPIHYAGMVWVGGLNEPATRYPQRRQVPIASGCVFMMRRALWEELGGFAPEYFAYHEDTELSLRCWQRDLSVEYVPDAVAVHHYEFSRNALKLRLVERNRLVLLLTTYQARSLLLLAPMLLVVELSMVAAAVAGGWWREKVAGWRWIWQNRRWVRTRRAQLQAERKVPDAQIARLMTATFDPGNVEAPPGLGVFNALSKAWWRLVRPLLPHRLPRRR